MKAFFQIAIASALAIFLCSCMTTMVRSDERPSPEKTYEATRGDLAFLWEAGVKGEPLFYGIPANQSVQDYQPPKTGFLSRLTISMGCLIDLPFSIISDTLFLPFDLFLPKKTSQGDEEVAAPEN